MINKKLMAFTLAEVLVTLAIIGVVAALTIPTVVTSYQKKMYVTQLKKSYNNLTNGFRSIMAQDGVTSLTDTTLWAKMPKNGALAYDLLNDSNKDFKNEFEKTFKVLTIEKNAENIENKYGIKYKDMLGNEELIPGLVTMADGSGITFNLFKQPSKDEDVKNLKEFQKKI